MSGGGQYRNALKVATYALSNRNTGKCFMVSNPVLGVEPLRAECLSLNLTGPRTDIPLNTST